MLQIATNLGGNLLHNFSLYSKASVSPDHAHDMLAELDKQMNDLFCGLFFTNSSGQGLVTCVSQGFSGRKLHCRFGKLLRNLRQQRRNLHFLNHFLRKQVHLSIWQPFGIEQDRDVGHRRETMPSTSHGPHL